MQDYIAKNLFLAVRKIKAIRWSRASDVNILYCKTTGKRCPPQFINRGWKVIVSNELQEANAYFPIYSTGSGI